MKTQYGTNEFVIYVHPDHPCYRIDVWKFEDSYIEEEKRWVSDIAKSQGYINIEEMAAFWKDNH